MRKRHRWLVPAVPPSVFPLPSTFCQQIISLPGNVDNRRVSTEARASSSVTVEKTDEDLIVDWDSFKTRCHTLGYPISVIDAGLMVLGLSAELHSPPTLVFSVFAGTDFKVMCYKNSSVIQVRHLINGFTLKLEKYSQFNEVIEYVSNTDPLLLDELHSLEKQLTSLCTHKDVDDDLKYQ